MEETRKLPRKPRAKAAAPATAKPATKPGTRAAKPAAPAKATAPGRTASATPARGDRDAMVRMAAYFRAEQRGFAPGNEWEDWLAAEAEIDALVDAAQAPKPRKAPARKTPKA